MWTKRATGIGYKKYPDLPEPIKVGEDWLRRIGEKSKTIRERVESLDEEMKSRGIKPIQRIWHRR